MKYIHSMEPESGRKQGPATRKNSAAQRLIKAMEKPPHLTDEDIEAQHQSIEEGKIPIKFDSLFALDERKEQQTSISAKHQRGVCESRRAKQALTESFESERRCSI